MRDHWVSRGKRDYSREWAGSWTRQRGGSLEGVLTIWKIRRDCLVREGGREGNDEGGFSLEGQGEKAEECVVSERKGGKAV